MTTLYSKEIRLYLHTRDWPNGLDWEIVEYYDPDYLGFRLFRQNFNSFDGEDRLQIAMTVKEVMENIRKQGIPIYMEVVDNAERTTHRLVD